MLPLLVRIPYFSAQITVRDDATAKTQEGLQNRIGVFFPAVDPGKDGIQQRIFVMVNTFPSIKRPSDFHRARANVLLLHVVKAVIIFDNK